MKNSLRYLLALLVLAAAACAAPTSPSAAAGTADASLDGVPTTTSSDSTSNRGPNTFGSGN
jgi:ABC-type transport system substrate-binding protein